MARTTTPTTSITVLTLAFLLPVSALALPFNIPSLSKSKSFANGDAPWHPHYPHYQPKPYTMTGTIESYFPTAPAYVPTVASGYSGLPTGTGTGTGIAISTGTGTGFATGTGTATATYPTGTGPPSYYNSNNKRHLPFFEHPASAYPTAAAAAAPQLEHLDSMPQSPHDHFGGPRKSGVQHYYPYAPGPYGAGPTMASGMMPSGTMPVGTTPSGTMPSGTMPTGTMPIYTNPTAPPSSNMPFPTAPYY
ncbi:hypothetical protein B0A50_05230 [Salinomyces thailandicus]|uniref:Uncharacterized protein n=1 Tax=Salinomyces thailandicus TaxID=706561 RepID=A0A4V5N4A9_9PEZI|nr:hypothetical protein B0A50_05230 [Salinomyces thailandica]